MTRGNLLYLIIGILIVVAIVFGYQLYQERKQPNGVEIKLGTGGVSVEPK